MGRFLLSLLAVTTWVHWCAAQASGWDLQDGQINTTMCYWTSPRAAVIRDTVYFDGGYLWWQPGMSDGSYGSLIADGNPLGLVYTLNFSQSFNASSNFSSLFSTISKASGGGNANNIGPNYVDGGMFANDYEWLTYGGLLQPTEAFPTQAGNIIAGYQQYPYGPPKQFAPSYVIKDLTGDITRYITDGAAVSVPSENLGYYFGGLRSSVWGEIVQSPGLNNTINADVNSLTMIEVNMAVQGSEVWSNLTLPTTVPGRASAEIVWVPVGDQGVLVAIGGVVDPAYANINGSNNGDPALNTISKQQSPAFINTVSIYDIKSSTWYEQPTSSGPGTTFAQGCAVVASAQDYSSHNIYWYGGFDGIDETQPFNDDVWILTLPSFMWMKVKAGDPSIGRAGHRCVKPYPDQMFIMGGYNSLTGIEPTCLDDGLIRVFNLSSAQWVDSYDPKIWSEYEVPDMIVNMIGGSPSGSATQTAPMQTGFSDSKLASIFGTKYNTSKIVDWYPYTPTTSPTSTPTPLPSAVSKSSGTPKYLAPVLGVVLGLFFITLVILAILLWRRRKYMKSNSGGTQSEVGTMDNRHWVTNWLRSTPADAKAPTVTTDDTPMTPYDDGDGEYQMPEVAGTQVHEMMDTSKPVELHDTGFVPLVTPTTGKRHPDALHSSSSVTSHTSRASTVSRDSHSPRPGISPMATPRPDSPPLNDSARAGFLSGVSNVSESDRGHLRGISETSVSSDGGGRSGRGSEYATPMEHGLALRDLPSPIGHPQEAHTQGGQEGGRRGVSPLTPPEGHLGQGDYIGAGSSQGQGQGRQRRKSNFAEGLDEVKK